MFSSSIKQLINHFAALPGIGPKTATRLVYYLLKQDNQQLTSFANTLNHLKDNVQSCAICHLINDQNPCHICHDQSRNQSQICVVAESEDASTIAKSADFKGVFHVLNGHLSPTEGITPNKLNIESLKKRIEKNNITEIILGLNPTLEGETTNLYLTKILKKYPGLKITRLARGLPQGADLEYADDITLSNALRHRTPV